MGGIGEGKPAAGEDERPMQLRLERRPQQSRAMTVLSPVLAIVLSLVTFFIIFAIMRIDPFEALYLYFIDPLTAVWSIEDLIVKAAPIILIAIGLSFCYQSNVWNIGAEGQLAVGAIFGSIIPVYFPDWGGPLVIPLMLLMGILGGMLYAAIPAWLKNRFNANETLTTLMLVYVANLMVDYLARTPWRDPAGHNFPNSQPFIDGQMLPVIFGDSIRLNVVFVLIAVAVAWFLTERTLTGFQIRVLGQSPRAGAFGGFDRKRMVMLTLLISGGLAGLAGICEVAGPIGQFRTTISPGYGFTAIIVAFLGRLHPVGILFAGLLLALSYMGGEGAQIALGISDQTTARLPGHAALLRARLRHADLLPPAHRAAGVPPKPSQARRLTPWTMVEGILLTIVTAATPLLFAALGELVAERSGVLNLGVEGMMAVGAVMGFAGGHVTGMPVVGVLSGIVAGALMGGLFGLVTLVFAANQIASGIALTLFGLGLSGPDRQRLHRHARPRHGAHPHSGSLRHSAVGPVIFGEDPLVYLAVALTIAVWLFLFRTNAGLIVRAVGDNHASAHALGYPVLRVRFLAVLFGGACAGLGGAYLSLVYTPQWTQAMTAGRGWIAIALVVFGTWLPWRIAIGALLFGAVSILQLNAQAFGLGIPSQFLSMLPYLITVIVLVIISRNQALLKINTPASLARTFVPDN